MVAEALNGFEALTQAQMMGANPPGPLEWVCAHVIDVATDERVMVTQGLVPLDGQPPAEVLSRPDTGY
jgi:hypothetical protein